MHPKLFCTRICAKEVLIFEFAQYPFRQCVNLFVIGIVTLKEVVAWIPGPVVDLRGSLNLRALHMSVLVAMHIRGLGVDFEVIAHKFGQCLRAHIVHGDDVTGVVLDRMTIEAECCMRFCDIPDYGREGIECIDWRSRASLASNSIRSQPVEFSDTVFEVVEGIRGRRWGCIQATPGVEGRW